MHCEICLNKIAISSPERSCPLSSGMGNKDHWQYAFELGISSAINRACAVPPEVEKYIFSQISNSKLRAGDVQALGTMVSSTKVQNNVVLRHINQQHVRRCCNFSFVSNRSDLFGAYLRARTFRVFYCECNTF